MYCTANNAVHCMLRDQTGAVLIKDPLTPLEAGMIVEVEGRTVFEKHTRVGTSMSSVQGAWKRGPCHQPLTTVAQVRSLSLDEADLAYPVHLRRHNHVLLFTRTDLNLRFVSYRMKRMGSSFFMMVSLPELWYTG